MAKSARASSRKVNNSRLKKSVFGPTESARTERLSAKLLELASQPKPQTVPETEMRDAGAEEGSKEAADEEQGEERDDTMDLDSKPSVSRQKNSAKNKIQKRRKKKSSTVFPKYSDRKGASKKKK